MGATATIEVRKIREKTGLSRRDFSRLAGYSERDIAGWEQGKSLTDPSRMRMTEINRLLTELAKVMNKDAITPWLETPNDAFDGLKPIEVAERGESDRLWRMIFHLESGIPA